MMEKWLESVIKIYQNYYVMEKSKRICENANLIAA